MHRDYWDIRSKLGEPAWWDEHGVPRYWDFDPDCLSVYAREAVLFEVRCQNCGRTFVVAQCHTHTNQVSGQKPLSERIPRELEYGDPPNIECCAGGPTMNSIPVRVLQFWSYEGAGRPKWVRKPELEVALECAWAKEE